MRSPRLIISLALLAAAASAHAAEPRVLVDGYKLELVAKEPDIVTPIGMTFDREGRLLVIESHTHQRPADYDGPTGDRIRMLSDSDGDGRLDKWSTFAEGFQQSMNLCLHPDGGVYLVTRRDVRLLEDTDGDGASDKETPILRLETEADYPHNGLSGIHVAAGDDGKPRLIIGLGENFGFAYRLVGSDDEGISGRAGVGTIFTCKLDGSNLERLAVGFWNPFSICTLAGHTFCIENDPDSSPPCRLIHVVPTGDYGHRWEYGRAGVHPLQAWNGELPGTLPMICGTGEAPTAIVAHRNYLWVTSWGDHRIERYELTPNGATFAAKSTIVAQGDADFRPTGMAIAPDGSLYFADWVDRSYPVHHKGRIWRLTLPSAKKASELESYFASGWNEPSQSMLGVTNVEKLVAQPESRDVFVRQRTVALWAGSHAWESINWNSADPRTRLCLLQALRWSLVGGDTATDFLRRSLNDADADVRAYAVRWIADERLNALRDDVAKLLDGDIPTERYFLAVLAAIEWLDGDASPRTSGISDGLLRRELVNSRRSPQIKALALRLISPDHEWLTIDRLREYLASDAPELRLEAVRTLAMQSRPERFAVLAEIAADDSCDAELRAEAVIGLASAVGEYGELLNKLAAGEKVVAKEAVRVLRLNRKRAAGAGVDPEQHLRPETTDLDAWNALLADGGDAASGRRLFFTNQALCVACHQHSGRGGRVGPDLTRLGEQQSRERIIASIIQPSQEIAPHYQAWQLVTTDGLTREGLRLPEGGDDGTEPYADTQGRRFELRSEDIELRSPLPGSIMPEGLVDLLTVEDLRDLVAFLCNSTATPRSP
jgi:putative membrane-bound dehydrogenase-like protein